MEILQLIADQGVTLGFCIICFLLYTDQNKKAMEKYEENMKAEKEENRREKEELMKRADEDKKQLLSTIGQFSQYFQKVEKHLSINTQVLETLVSRVDGIEKKMEVEQDGKV